MIITGYIPQVFIILCSYFITPFIPDFVHQILPIHSHSSIQEYIPYFHLDITPDMPWRRSVDD